MGYHSTQPDHPHIIGVPTYGLSDNEKTLTLDHIARIAMRHPTIVEVGRFYDVCQLCPG